MEWKSIGENRNEISHLMESYEPYFILSLFLSFNYLRKLMTFVAV